MTVLAGVCALAPHGIVARSLTAQVAPARTDTSRRTSVAAPLRVDSALTRTDTSRRTVGSPGPAGADTTRALTPTPDQPRGVDAELRVALLDLTEGRTLQALSRLDWLATSPVALTGVETASGALLAREAMLFLLAETQYRLGMWDAFQSTAQQLLTAPGGSRYAAVLRVQLMLDAYRRADYARVATYASAAGTGPGDEQALSKLVAGLAQYATRNYVAARTAFDSAAQSPGRFGGYARYMSVLASVAADTTQATQAAETMRALAGQTAGDFADQVNLTAAQLTYQRGQFAAAAALAANVAPTSGLGAQALLTRGWALYKSNQLDGAVSAFQEFASRFPQLPERDEARLMVGQVLLQSGHTDDAGRHFQSIADSLNGESAALQTRAGAAMTDAARALVAARATALLFLNQPSEGKTIALPDEGQGTQLAAMVTGAPPQSTGDSVAAPDPARPGLVTITDISARLDSLSSRLGTDFPRRLVFVPSPGGATSSVYLQRLGAWRRADVVVALARYRLQQQLDAYNAKIALYQRLRQALSTDSAAFSTLGTQLERMRDSLQRVSDQLDATQARLKGVLRSEAEAARAIAAENRASLDSLRTASGGLGMVTPEDQAIYATETTTATTYEALATAIASGLDSAFAHHPVSRLRDTVRSRLDRSRALLAETQSTIGSANQIVAQELTRLQAGEPNEVRTARATMSTAEAQRSAAEAQLVGAVDSELRARAGRLLALMRHDTEAAQFGAASAAFFKAAETGGAAPSTPTGTAPTPTGIVGGARDDASAPPTTNPAAVPGAGASGTRAPVKPNTPP